MIAFLDGKFASYMQVEIQNDGPVTIPIESRVDKLGELQETESKNKETLVEMGASHSN